MCLGLADRPAQFIFDDRILGGRSMEFLRWGEPSKPNPADGDGGRDNSLAVRLSLRASASPVALRLRRDASAFIR